MNEWCTIRSGGRWIGNRIQFFIIYLNEFGGLACLIAGFGNYHCYGITHVLYTIGHQQGVRWLLHGIAILEVHLPATGNTIDTSSSNICSGIYFHYSFCALGSGDVYSIDFSVSVGAT